MTAMSSSTVLVTGVAGFLGRYVAREFLRLGWRVIGLDVVAEENAPPSVEYHRMVLPNSDFAGLLVQAQPNACIHCAGRASVGHSLIDPAADFRDSATVTFELLDALRLTAARCRTVLLSSAAVYGNPTSLPVSETHALSPLSPYGYHKLMCEHLAEEFFRIYGLPTVVVRVFSAYGPGLRRQVIWDICQRALTSDTLRLHGTGDESRDFIHAADIAAGIALLVEKAPFEANRYNLATGCETTIKSLAEQVVEELGGFVVPVYDGISTPGDPRNWRADISQLAALGFSPRISLGEGLRGVAAWAKAELSLAT